MKAFFYYVNRYYVGIVIIVLIEFEMMMKIISTLKARFLLHPFAIINFYIKKI